MRALASLVALLFAGTAHADSTHWYSGADGKRRLTHLGLSALGGAVYFSSELLFKDTLAPSECRWCNPTNLDRSVRDAVLWNDRSRAGLLSTLDGYVLSPVAGIGLLMVGSFQRDEDSVGRWIDDALPIIESSVVAGLLNQTAKFIVGEQRPLVHFADPTRAPEVDDNMSFYSGHSTLAFAIATSAGVVAHRRGYKLAPLIWATGYVIAGTTGYLRIAADKHYFTDVMVGAVTGTGIGLAVPYLFHRSTLSPGNVDIVPTGNGVAIVGAF